MQSRIHEHQKTRLVHIHSFGIFYVLCRVELHIYHSVNKDYEKKKQEKNKKQKKTRIANCHTIDIVSHNLVPIV